MQEQAVSMGYLEKRKTRRVSDAMALRVENASEAIGHAPLDTTPTHVVNISTGGLRFLHEKNLPPSESLLVTLCLGPQKETVSLRAEVISSVEATNQSGNKRYNSRVKFKNVDKAALALLDQHISYVLNKTYMHCKEFQYKATA